MVPTGMVMTLPLSLLSKTTLPAGAPEVEDDPVPLAAGDEPAAPEGDEETWPVEKGALAQAVSTSRTADATARHIDIHGLAWARANVRPPVRTVADSAIRCQLPAMERLDSRQLKVLPVNEVGQGTARLVVVGPGLAGGLIHVAQ